MNEYEFYCFIIFWYISERMGLRWVNANFALGSPTARRRRSALLASDLEDEGDEILYSARDWALSEVNRV
jgi:hypothetical protein